MIDTPSDDYSLQNIKFKMQIEKSRFLNFKFYIFQFAFCNCPLNIRDQLLNPLGISFFDELRSSEATFSIRRFLRQNMPGKGPFGLNLPCPGLLKSLCRSSISLYFRHDLLPFMNKFNVRPFYPSSMNMVFGLGSRSQFVLRPKR